MPLFFLRLGVKKMLLAGMIAWLIRYLFFAYGNVESGISLLYLGIILHGVCYDFFFVTGQIYTDEKAGPAIRSSAQGMITLATYGVGMLIGFWFAGLMTEQFKTTDGHIWKTIWLIPAGISAVMVVCFGIFFKDTKKITV
jgi:MFS family permease